MVMRRRRLERFGHVKRRDETENIRAVVEMKMEGKRPRGRPKLSWKGTVRPEGPESLEHQEGMGHCQGTMGRSRQDPLPRTGRRRRKVRKNNISLRLRVHLVRANQLQRINLIALSLCPPNARWQISNT